MRISNHLQLKPTTPLLILPALENRAIINLSQPRRSTAHRRRRRDLPSAFLLSSLRRESRKHSRRLRSGVLTEVFVFQHGLRTGPVGWVEGKEAVE